MISGGRCQLGSHELYKQGEKNGYKGSSLIRDYRVGESMKPEDVGEDEFCELRSISRFINQDEVSCLSKTISKYPDRITSLTVR